MPPPAFGKGNAFHKPINERFVELSRRDAKRLAGIAAALDSNKESDILRAVTTSALDGGRKQEACKEIRKALALCRRGVDPRAEESVVGHKGGWVYTFLCLERIRKPAQPEKGVAASVWQALDKYLIECRGDILEQVCGSYPPPANVCAQPYLARLACPH